MDQRTCVVCGELLTGQHRVLCGSKQCKQRRYRQSDACQDWHKENWSGEKRRAQRKPDEYHRECAWCGKAYVTRYRRGQCCSRECGHRHVGRLGTASCAVPDDHPSRSTPVPDDHPSRVVASKFTPVRYGECADCGRCFVDTNYDGAPRKRWCSKLCIRRVNNRRRKAMEHDAPGMYTLVELMRKFAEQGGCCTYCLRVVDGRPEPDHVVPLSRYGTNWISNIVPSCHRCNHDKSNLLLHEWARRRQDRLQPELPGLAGMLDAGERLLLTG